VTTTASLHSSCLKWEKETGFLNKDFRPDAKAIAETRFLAWKKETGFLNKDFPWDAKVIAETRFLKVSGNPRSASKERGESS
jgi:hypothetical protein